MNTLDRIKELLPKGKDDQKEETKEAVQVQNLRVILEKGITEPKWIVKDLIPQRGVTIIGGTASSYKTWASMSLALCCVLERPFMDKFEVQKCPVLFIDEENGDITTPFRFRKLLNGIGVILEEEEVKKKLEELNISIFPGIRLDNDDGLIMLKNLVEKVKPKLIIIDSMVRCMNGSEDKVEDVRKVFDTLKEVFKNYDECSFVLLHHTTKNTNGRNIQSLRGSGDFAAFADVILMFSSKHDGYAYVDVVKNRHINMEDFKGFSFAIQDVYNKEKTERIGLTLTYADSVILKDAIAHCKNDILDWIEAEGKDYFQTYEVQKYCEDLGHSHNSVSSALNELLDARKLIKQKRGHWKVKQDKNIDEY